MCKRRLIAFHIAPQTSDSALASRPAEEALSSSYPTCFGARGLTLNLYLAFIGASVSATCAAQGDMESSQVYLNSSEDRKEEQRNDEGENKRQEDNSEDKARSRCDGERMSMGQARDRSSARREHAAQDGRKRMPVILDSRTH